MLKEVRREALEQLLIRPRIPTLATSQHLRQNAFNRALPKLVNITGFIFLAKPEVGAPYVIGNTLAAEHGGAFSPIFKIIKKPR